MVNLQPIALANHPKYRYTFLCKGAAHVGDRRIRTDEDRDARFDADDPSWAAQYCGGCAKQLADSVLKSDAAESDTLTTEVTKQ